MCSAYIRCIDQGVIVDVANRDALLSLAHIGIIGIAVSERDAHIQLDALPIRQWQAGCGHGDPS